MFLWCVQEVAELKEEDIISRTVTDTQLPAELSEFYDEYCPCYYV